MDSKKSRWFRKNPHGFPKIHMDLKETKSIRKNPHGFSKIYVDSQKSTWIRKNPHGFEKIHMDSKKSTWILYNNLQKILQDFLKNFFPHIGPKVPHSRPAPKQKYDIFGLDVRKNSIRSTGVKLPSARVSIHTSCGLSKFFSSLGA